MTTGNLPYGCTCGFYWSVVPPSPCLHHSPPAVRYSPPASDATSALTDDDVERIAARVVELARSMLQELRKEDWEAQR